MVDSPILNFSIVPLFPGNTFSLPNFLNDYLLEIKKPILWVDPGMGPISMEYFNSLICNYDIAYCIRKGREILTDVIWLNNTDITKDFLRCWHIQVLAFPEKLNRINLRDSFHFFPHKNKLRVNHLPEEILSGKSI